MHPRRMIKLKLQTENPFEMVLVENNNVIQAFSSNRTDHAFSVGVEPGRARSRDYFLDAHIGNPIAERRSVDSVTVTNQDESSSGSVISEQQQLRVNSRHPQVRFSVQI